MGDRIRKRRLDLNLQQAEVAKLIGVTEACVWNWESNTSSPNFRLWPAIVGFLGETPAAEEQSFGENLVTNRKVRGFSQKQFARELGVDPATLARWERDERLPAAKFLRRIEALAGL